jgi:predicted nucleic acid-binding protein
VTRYLVDTNVISSAAPTKAVTRPELIKWMDAHSADLFLSVVTIAEIADGVAKARCKSVERKALPFDAATAEIAGALSDLARGRGHSPGFADVAIAAMARHRGLTILSRKKRHFADGRERHRTIRELPPNG